MPCKRCGQCCTVLHFILPVDLEDDKQGYSHFVSYHHCEVFGVRIENSEKLQMAVKVPLTCKYLKFDGNTGLASCAIYKERPTFCREHLCNAAKED